MRVAPQAGAPVRDAPFGGHVRHLGDDEPRPADRATPQVNQVPVLRDAVLRGVLAHRTDDDTIRQRQLAQRERREDRRRRGLPGRYGHSARSRHLHRHVAHEGRVAQREVVVRDAPGAGHEVEREERRRLVDVPRRVLEPLEARLCSPLRPDDVHVPLLLVRGERGAHLPSVRGPLAAERVDQGDGVLHCELRPRSNREVGRVQRVAHQHDVLVVPVRVRDCGKRPPLGAIRQQPVPAEVPREERLAVAHGVSLRGAIEPRAPPRLLATLDDERGAPLLERVCVDLEEAMLALLEEEGEGLERPVRPEPAELGLSPVDRRLEVLRVARSHDAVDAVGAEDEVRLAGDGVDIRDLALEHELHADVATPVVQDRQEPLATRDRRTRAPSRSPRTHRCGFRFSPRSGSSRARAPCSPGPRARSCRGSLRRRRRPIRTCHRAGCARGG